MPPNDTTKLCPTCDTIKPLTDFNKNRTKADGHAYSCRECMRGTLREWRKANPERYKNAIRKSKEKNPAKYRAQIQIWEQSHPDKVQEAKKRYADAHPYDDARRAYFRQLYQNNKQKMQARITRYRKSHPEGARIRARRRRALKGHKRIHGWPALRAWFGECCLCCGATRRIEADHVIPLAKGGPDTLANLQPLCRSCNASKATSTIDYRDPERLAAFLTSYSPAPTAPLCDTLPSVPPT